MQSSDTSLEKKFFLSSSSPLNVLISQPNLYNHTFYLPYVWACLKAHCNQVPILAEHCNWLAPLFYNDDTHVLLADLTGIQIDVLGLSCYTWNFGKNVKIAKSVKKSNPHCLVIAGGPEPDYKDPLFFHKYPEIDMIVRQDGEIPFSKILLKRIKNENDFTDIPGLVLPTGKDRVPFFTGKTELPVDFTLSPYVVETSYLEELIERHLKLRSREIRVFWETNRGCPYGCTFCDWGSNTVSKIRAFPIERLQAELFWISEHQIKDLLITDANFGIYPRDLEIARMLCSQKEKTGYPRKVYYSVAKNNTERVVEIARVLYEKELIDFHILSIQTTDHEVMAAMNRTMLPRALQKKIVDALAKLRIPMLFQIILGSPGDNLEKWKRTLTDIMEWGVHEGARVFPFNILPNAPAAEAKYREQWKIVTILRPAHKDRRTKEFGEEVLSKTAYVVETSSYSKSDWVEMFLFSTFVQAFHGGAITRYLAIYLRKVHGISYFQFYDVLWNELRTHKRSPFVDKIILKCEKHLQRFLSDENAVEGIEIDLLPEASNLYSLEEYLLFYVLVNLDQIWKDLEPFFQTRFPFNEKHFESLMEYQKAVLITPDYNSEEGRVLESDFHWQEFFERVLTPEADSGGETKTRSQPHEQSLEVFMNTGFQWKNTIRFSDKHCGSRDNHALDWWQFPPNSSAWYKKYLERVTGVHFVRFSRTTLRQSR